MVAEPDSLDSLPAEQQAEVLLQRWQKDGDLEALDRLMRDQIGQLRLRILNQGPGGLSASLGATDAANEVVVKLLDQDSVPKFVNPAAMRGYLWRCARNLLIDRLRAKRGENLRLDGTAFRGSEELLAVSGGQAERDRAELNDALYLAMNLLSDSDREVLEFSYLQEMSVKETAEELGIAPEAVKMRLVRARRRLAERLARWRELVEGASS
ncbi:MAG TPA: sigma-70 family RNA polymerase sigma factor [Planctomycetes bacterium]|jgi:RNA polymerase sigma factor (sigma-70 family)|nr:sigma-70 family RNA polymerase sigma factor [Planctomycetota bacterium]HIL36143.1 sigma-70 family RNA polymerase sigma factor [Planctomycetota bacterium]